MNCDVAVVGNGPAGCAAAKHAAEKNDVLIVGGGERKVQCAGLISKTGMESIGVRPRDFVLAKIRGARIHSPGGVTIEVDGGDIKAYVVDRLGFDQHMLEQAEDAGAKYTEDWATSLRGKIKLKSGKTVNAKKTILATGSNLSLQIEAGLDRPREFLIGGQYEMKAECEGDLVELYFTVPDFFAWVIPFEDKARIGLCVKTNPRPYLDAFVKRLKDEKRIRSDRILAETFGIIPIHNPATKTQFGDIATVGDAAGQVKASTGGGVIFGAIAAEYATRPDYEMLWRKRIGNDLRLHLFIHRTLNRLTDKGKDRLFRIISETHTCLEKSGDMDWAGRTLQGVLRNPGFLAKTAVNLPMLLADMR